MNIFMRSKSMIESETYTTEEIRAILPEGNGGFK